MCGPNLHSKIIVEKYIGKSMKLSAAFMDLEKAYGRAEKKEEWDAVAGELLEGVISLYKGDEWGTE